MGNGMSKLHKLNRKSSKSHRDSARRILENIDKKNRQKKLLSAKQRLAELGQQRVAVRFLSSFGPDLDAIDAFKKGEDYQGFVGKGKNKRLKFEVKGNKLFLLGHNIATKTKGGISVNNAGFDTGLTYATLKELGVNAKRTPGGKAILHNKEIDAASGQSVFVPNNEVSSTPIRASKPQKKTIRPNRTVTEQSAFREKVESQAKREQGRGEGELPLSSTTIQPEDQRTINKITGVKSKIPKETRATDAHHIFPVERAPGLRNNPSQGVMVTRKEHGEIHGLNPNKGFKKIGKLQARLANLELPIRKKKKIGTVKKKIDVKRAMIQTAKMLSADAIVDAFIKSGIDIKGVNGVYDPIQNRVLDATIPADKQRIMELFESKDANIGFNSITDTRAGPSTDIEKVRAQLKEIEARGGIPSLGFDEGSLEANDTVIGNTDTIMSKLLDNQRSTGIVSPNAELEIKDNPRFTGNT
jgi:hypothetical protein